jgi:WD40 repeat protein
MSGGMPFPGGMPGRPPKAETPPLVDLLGATWLMGAPVVGAVWDGDVAGFGLGDGTLAVARGDWPGAPKLGPREGGGSELVPASQSPPPVSRQSVHEGACLSLATDPAGGFLTGGDDGALQRTTRDGDTVVIAHYRDHWVDLVASSAAGWRACSIGRKVHLSGPGSQTIDLPATATAMAFDTAGRRLAVAYYHGVTVWQADAPPVVLTTQGCPRSVAWSPDGSYLICGLQENALHGWRMSDAGDIEMGGYPGQPRSLAFSADGSFLASSGSPRVVCWQFDPPSAGSQPRECGLPSSRLPVCQVACHPTHPLIAAGYHNGAVLLCQPGRDDVLFAKGSSGGSVSALAWSACGQRLAMGTQGGEICVVSLPAALFRFGTAGPQSGKYAQ